MANPIAAQVPESPSSPAGGWLRRSQPETSADIPILSHDRASLWTPVSKMAIEHDRGTCNLFDHWCSNCCQQIEYGNEPGNRTVGLIEDAEDRMGRSSVGFETGLGRGHQLGELHHDQGPEHTKH